MSVLYIILILLMATVVQTTVLSHFSFSRITPDLFLILSVYFGLSFGKISGPLAGVITGILQDVLAGGLLGTNSLGKGFSSFFCSMVSDRLAGGNVISQFCLLFTFTFIDGLLTQFIDFIAFKNNVPFNYFAPGLLWLSLFNSVAGCFIIHFLNRAEKRLIGKAGKDQRNGQKRSRFKAWG